MGNNKETNYVLGCRDFWFGLLIDDKAVSRKK